MSSSFAEWSRGILKTSTEVSWSTRVTPAFRSFDVERPKSLANGREYTEYIRIFEVEQMDGVTLGILVGGTGSLSWFGPGSGRMAPVAWQETNMSPKNPRS